MTVPRPLRVGFLHVGRERSGLRRYGSILAAEARARPDLAVFESDAGGPRSSWRALRAAAQELHEAEVVHVQWKLADWGVRTGGLPRLEVFVRTLRRPLVVTMHDVFVPGGRWQRRASPTAIGLHRLGRVASSLVVHSEDERFRLSGFVPAERLEVVPHFVEVRASLPDRDLARRALDVEGRRVLTLLGYLTRRRGHRLVIDALRELPDDVVALFAGSVIEGRDHVADELRAHAADAGVAGRVRFLGYVPDERLDELLSATDVALCPFRAMSASGALATWLSAGTPVVTSDLAPFRELDAMSPGALHPFAPYEPGSLARVILATLEAAPRGPDPRVQALAQRLAAPRIMHRYVGLYHAAADRGR